MLQLAQSLHIFVVAGSGWLKTVSMGFSMQTLLARWLLSGVITTTVVLNAMEVRASIVLTENDLSWDVGADDALQQWLISADARTSTSSLFVISAPQEQESQRDSEPEEVDDVLANSPLGMAPSNTPLSQVTGSGNGGSAIASNLEEFLHDSLPATLSPESKTDLPQGPTFRWFRPPRV